MLMGEWRTMKIVRISIRAPRTLKTLGSRTHGREATQRSSMEIVNWWVSIENAWKRDLRAQQKGWTEAWSVLRLKEDRPLRIFFGGFLVQNFGGNEI